MRRNEAASGELQGCRRRVSSSPAGARGLSLQPPMNLYEQQAANRRAHVARDGRVRRCSLRHSSARASISFVHRRGRHVRPVGTIRGAGDRRRAGVVELLRFGDRAVLKSSAAEPLDERLRRSRPTTMSCATAARQRRRGDGDRLRAAEAGDLRRPRSRSRTRLRPVAMPRHASIAVTRGLLKTLNREELQGVVAHEMSPHPESRHPPDDGRRGARWRARAARRLASRGDAVRRRPRSASRATRARGGGGRGDRVSRRLAGRDDAGAARRAAAGDGRVPPARISGGRDAARS